MAVRVIVVPYRTAAAFRSTPVFACSATTRVGKGVNEMSIRRRMLRRSRGRSTRSKCRNTV